MKTNTILQPPAHLLAIASIGVTKLLGHAQLLDRNNQPIYHNEPQQWAPQCQPGTARQRAATQCQHIGHIQGIPRPRKRASHQQPRWCINRFVDVRARRSALMVAAININAAPITAIPAHRSVVGNMTASGHSQATTNANPPRPNKHASGT